MPEELACLYGDSKAGESDRSGEEIGRQLFRLVVRARKAGRDLEMELRSAARRYVDLVLSRERS